MRGWLIGLGLPLVLACSGKSVVSNGKGPTQASVEASLPSWCQSTCENLAACDCNCSGDDCDCRIGIESVSDCSRNCRAELTDGARLNQACAQEIDRFKSCVDAQGCAVVNSEVCSLDDVEACDDDNDVVNESPGAGPALAGAGGSAPGSGPSAPPMVGTAGTSAIPADPPVHCSSGGGGGGVGPSPGGAQVICETSYGDCSNGSSYYAICVSTSAGQSSCSCFVDDRLSIAFDPAGVCPSLTQLNHGCGWNIQ